MEQFQAFGTFYKSSGHLCRKSAYLQFGTSKKSLGSTIMLNPGAAELIDRFPKSSNQEVLGKLKPDETMKRLSLILQQINPNPLDGRFHIYNLFALQDASSKNAVKKEKWVEEAWLENIEIINQFQAEKHPWVLLAWSTEKSVKLRKLKEQWLTVIEKSNIKVFGLKAKGENMFYHPYPRKQSDKERYLKEIVQQMKDNKNIRQK